MTIRKEFPNFLNIAVIPDNRIIASEHYEIDGSKTKFIKDAPLIKILSEILDFKFKLIVGNGEFGDSLSDGNWTGMIGMVQRGEADIAIGKLSVTEARATIVDFSYPYLYNPITFATDRPTHSINKYAMLNPFSSSVWIAVFVSLILIQCISYIINIKQKPAANLPLKIYGSLLEKSVNFNLRSHSAMIFLLVSWLIGAMFLSQIYKAFLLSFLTFPSSTGIRDIAQLSKACEESSFKCSAFKGSKTYTDILSSGGESWKKVAECLARSDMYTENVQAFLGSSAYRKAFIGTKFYTKAFQKSYFISDDYFYVDLYSIAVRKSFCCKNAFDRAIHNIAAIGIFDKFVKDEEFFFSLENDYINEEFNVNEKLSIEELFGAFVLLVLGYILASVVFLIEVLTWRAQKVNQKIKALPKGRDLYQREYAFLNRR